MRSLRFSTLLLFSFILTSVHSQELMSPESLWKLGRVNLEDISKDKAFVLYSVTNYILADNKGNQDLYLVSVNGDNAKRLTDFSGSDSDGLFSPDGTKIGFLRDGVLWEMNLDGSKQMQVGKEEIDGFKYSSDGKNILFIKDVKYFQTVKEMYPDLPGSNVKVIDGLMYRHWKSWEDDKRNNVFIQGYKNGVLVGEAKNIMNVPFDSPVKPQGGMEQIEFSSDGTKIAYSCRKENGTALALSTNSDIFLYVVVTGETKNLSVGIMGYDLDPVFSPDGKYIAWRSMKTAGNEADKSRLMLMNLQTGKKTDLTEKYDRDAENICWSNDGTDIYFISGADGTQHIFAMNVATGKLRQITAGLYDYSTIKDGGTFLIAQRMSMTEPPTLVRVEKKDGKTTEINQTNTAFWNTIKKAKVEKKYTTTTDGKKMLVWHILPPDFDPKKKYPTLLYCQGGPQSHLSQFFSFRWNFQLMASKGYIIVAPCRRGMPGFGEAWNAQISGDWGGQCMRDYFSAIDDATKLPYVNKDKLGAIGASFGGYSVYWLAGHHEKRFKAFIAHAGIFNFESMYGTTEEMFFENHEKGGAYWEIPRPKMYSESPHLTVNKWDTPILVTHGEKDFRVPIDQGMQAFQAAQLRNIPSKFLWLPDEGHWIQNPHSSVLWQLEFYSWLDKYLK
ncbi:MAG: S9 family peptidase [Saprospiraceae bacterium]